VTVSEPLRVVRAADLASDAPEQRWLIDGLWSAAGVGVIGGPPKACKSWLGLEMAVSVASGTTCLGTFRPAEPGRVLVYMAEDADAVVRERLVSLCRHHGVRLDALELYVIVADTLRIDLHCEQQRLREAIARIRPRMLLLDPLVRLHGVNENSAPEVSALLAYLRALQREHGAAVVLVHHTRKSGSNGQPGQALRGSGDIHAWTDSAAYLVRKRDRLRLAIEHRAAPSPEALTLELVEGDTPHLAITSPLSAPATDLDEAVVELLHQAARPVTRTALRARLRTRNERLGKTLVDLEQRGLIRRDTGGWTLAPDRSAPRGSEGTERSQAAR